MVIARRGADILLENSLSTASGAKPHKRLLKQGTG